mgnify:CR=1 FL=1
MAKKLNLELKTLFEVISTATGSCWAINNYCPIPGVGPTSPADNNYLGGLRSTCTYINASSMKNMAKCTTFIRVSQQVNDLFK